MGGRLEGPLRELLRGILINLQTYGFGVASATVLLRLNGIVYCHAFAVNAS